MGCPWVLQPTHVIRPAHSGPFPSLNLSETAPRLAPLEVLTLRWVGRTVDKPIGTVVVTLRVLAVVWLIGWAVYVAFWAEDRVSSPGDLVIALGILLIPAAVAFTVAWAIEVVASIKADRRKSPDGLQR